MIDFEQIKNHQGVNLLVNFDDWAILGPNGESYKAAWGKCFVKQTEDAVGFTPKGDSSTDWFMQIGEGEGALFVFGCRIHYVRLMSEKPNNPTQILVIE